MTTASAFSVALVGMEGTIIEVEAAVGAGLPRTILVGLPDAALYEARDRCKAAVAGAGLGWPDRLLTINLIPASLPKSGSHYDLAIIAAVLASSGVVPPEACREVVLLGEVGLDGRVRSVRGILPALVAARCAGYLKAIVPMAQTVEAQLVDGITVWGVAHVDDLVEVLHGRPVLCPPTSNAQATTSPIAMDLADVVGQPEARWALEVAAAGGHHIFFHGPPGVGKTMLAERLPGLLPDLDDEQALEVSAIHSLAGEDLTTGLIRRPPYADPHHNVSMAAMVGGGSRVARPGAISLAHRGVLFLDEAPHFESRVLDALRTPLESGWVSIARSQVTTRYPARFQLVLAANPCPCGLALTPGATCRCTPMSIRRYNDRLSGPILDRIDIHQYLLPMRKAFASLPHDSPEPTAVVAERVAEARRRTAARLKVYGWTTNVEASGKILRTQLLKPEGMELVDKAVLRGQLSSRGVDKVLRLAWTLADLAGRNRVIRDDIAAALQLRRGEWVGTAA